MAIALVPSLQVVLDGGSVPSSPTTFDRVKAAAALDALLDYLEDADFDRVLWEAHAEYEYARQCFDEAVSAEADLHRVAPDEPWADLEKYRPWFSSFVLAVLRKEAANG